MRILMTCDALRPPVRGVGRVCETLLPELVRLGAEVTPLDWRENPHATRLAGRACRVVPGLAGPARTARWYASLLPRLDDDAVVLSTAGFPHVRGAHPRLAVLVHDLHMLEPGYYRPGKRLWFRAFLRRGLQKARLRICVSDHTRRELERRFPELDPSRNVVVHNAVPDAFGGDGEPRDRGRQHFLFVGQLERRKNLARLLEAYAGARADGVRTPLHLVGRPGDGADEILGRARELDVIVHTAADDVELRRLYRGARALLLPSLAEGFGLPVVEAMQAGVPVLTSAGTALEEVAGDAALLVEPRDADSIRRGIVSLDRDAALRAELIERGTLRRSAFTPAAQARAVLAALQLIQPGHLQCAFDG